MDGGVTGLTEERYNQLRETLKRTHDPETAWYKDPDRVAAAVEKSKKTRAANKNFHKLAKYMMEAMIPDNDAAAEELREHGFDQGDYQTAVFWGQLKKAIYSCDTEAAKYVRDTAGYKPTETMQVGNLDDTPFEMLDLSKLSNAELRAMIAKRETVEE